MAKKAKAVAQRFETTFIYGDMAVDPNGFNQLRCAKLVGVLGN